MRKSRRKPIFIIIEVIIVLAFLVGGGIALYPFFNSMYYNHRDQSLISEFSEFTMNIQKIRVDDEDNGSYKMISGLKEDLEEYNQQLITEGQGKINDIMEYSSFPVDINQYGLPDEMIGYISIQAIGVKLPLYLGADYENMVKGAAVMGQTSAPIGGENTNCVIAGHAGWRGTNKFRYLENLKLGDQIDIVNPWGTLTYNVVESKIIYPNEINEVLIRQRKDMITLVTCHPYSSNGEYRLLVYAERTEQ